MKKWTIAAVTMFAVSAVAGSYALARSKDDCQTAWARSVRSYLTQNRRAGPDGKVPTTLDEEELMVQAWNSAFGPACDLEAQGNKAEARISAAATGAKILAKLDRRGCVNFMDSYMGSSKAKDICDIAGGAGSADLKAKIRSSIPPR